MIYKIYDIIFCIFFSNHIFTFSVHFNEDERKKSE